MFVPVLARMFLDQVRRNWCVIDAGTKRTGPTTAVCQPNHSIFGNVRGVVWITFRFVFNPILKRFTSEPRGQEPQFQQYRAQIRIFLKDRRLDFAKYAHRSSLATATIMLRPSATF